MKKSLVKKESKFGKLSNFWIGAIKGSLWAVALILICILFVAVIIRFTSISDSFIMPINQVIKVFSILIGCMMGAKTNPEKGLKMGLLVGLFYSIVSYLLFSLLSGSWSIDLSTFVDIVFSTLIGGICGIFAVNIANKQ